MSTTIFMPISREEHLPKVFHALEELDCDIETTNLFTLVDGDSQLFVKARNFTTESKFKQRLCVQRKPDGRFSGYDLVRRRLRIAAIHNEAKQHIQACDYVFLVEDDTVIPPRALSQLLSDYSIHPYAGFIEGAELGRHGITYVGAWRADDVYEPTKLETLLPNPMGIHLSPGVGIRNFDEVDAGGFYCTLVKRANYMGHEFKPLGNNDLGPDVDFGLSMRREGYRNYIDWSINCQHLVSRGSEIETLAIGNTPIQRVMMTKEDNNWRRTVE